MEELRGFLLLLGTVAFIFLGVAIKFSINKRIDQKVEEKLNERKENDKEHNT